jgi:hypothetical protein
MTGTAPTAQGFWGRRWRGQAAWRVLFWRDMLTVGTVINLCTGFAALMLISQGQPIAWALAVHFLPVPYNAFLLASLWRTPGRPDRVKFAGCAWFAAMLLV